MSGTKSKRRLNMRWSGEKRCRNEPPIIIQYNQILEAFEIVVIDPDSTYPLYFIDEAGRYQIRRTKTGKIQMCK